MAEAQLVEPVLEDVVVDVVEQMQVLADDCHAHLLELALEIGQVSHDDFHTPAEEAGFERAWLGPLPHRLVLVFLLCPFCGCDFSKEEAAVAGEEISNHLSAAQRVVVVVEGGAETAHCQKQPFY